MNTTIDTGDIVKHLPSGKKWVVAYVEGKWLACCGWPFTLVEVTDYVLLEKTTPQARYELLHSLSRMSNEDGKCDLRKSYAIHRLSEEAAAKEKRPKAELPAAPPAGQSGAWWDTAFWLLVALLVGLLVYVANSAR